MLWCYEHLCGDRSQALNRCRVYSKHSTWETITVIVVATSFLPFRGHCGGGWGFCPRCFLRAKESWQTAGKGREAGASWGWIVTLSPSFFFWLLCFLLWTWLSVWLGPSSFSHWYPRSVQSKYQCDSLAERNIWGILKTSFFSFRSYEYWLMSTLPPPNGTPNLPPPNGTPQNGRLGTPLLLCSLCIPSRAPHPQ